MWREEAELTGYWTGGVPAGEYTLRLSGEELTKQLNVDAAAIPIDWQAGDLGEPCLPEHTGAAVTDRLDRLKETEPSGVDLYSITDWDYLHAAAVQLDWTNQQVYANHL